MEKLYNVNGVNVAPNTKLSYVKANPKRKNSAAHARFANYMKAKTVDQFFKSGGTLADLRYDQNKAFVEIAETAESKPAKHAKSKVEATKTAAAA